MPAPVRRSGPLPRPRRAPDDLAAQRPGRALLDVAESRGPRSKTVRTLARLVGVRTRDRSWRVGAAGESKVGRKLDRLRGWRVLHNVPLPGGGDVDHLLIGPHGVLAVNTKHHKGAEVAVGREAVFVRGKAYNYPTRSLTEARRVGEVFARAGHRVNVASLVVVHGHAGKVRGWIRRRPLGVQVVPSGQVWWWMRLPGRRVLDREQVEALYALARKGATWSRASGY